ncbi:protein rapunzel-like [Megalops cyprinoides]|uniref:protein rapunzel-like n=1 Tax=Megalops cyprinoides TaxID=118141 RepID=UPI001864C20C|nr:protein rapunzel-like [Megalops cyprinoides]
MATELMKQLADKKDSVEAFMETLEKGAELVAETMGEMLPVFSIAAPVVKLVLDNVESREAEFMKEQFQKLRDRLEVVSEEIQRINQEIQKSGADAAYFSVEENLSNQFRKFMDILNAKPKFREVKTKLFLEHFAKTGGDKNLHTLYAAVTGDNFSGESVLEITLNYEEKSRRAVEDFCARLKNLFCLGLIALVGHAGLKGTDEEEDLVRDWGEKMKVVEEKMKAAVEICKSGFAEQAKFDIGKRLKGWTSKTHTELADAIAEFLAQKFDWVSWAVRVYTHTEGWLGNLIYGKKDQGIYGGNHFAFEGQLRVVVSYSLNPSSIDRDSLRRLIEGQRRTRNMDKLALRIHSAQPHCLVHVVSKHRDVAEKTSNFPDDFRYYQLYRNSHIYIHSE